MHSSHTMSPLTPLTLSASVTYGFASLPGKHHELIFCRRWRLIIKSFPNLWSSWMNHWSVNDVHLFTCVARYALCFNFSSYLGLFHDLDGKTDASCVTHVFLGFILSLTISAANCGYQTQHMAVERVRSVKRFTLWLLSLFIHNISLIHPSRHCSIFIPFVEFIAKAGFLLHLTVKSDAFRCGQTAPVFVSSSLQGPLWTI